MGFGVYGVEKHGPITVLTEDCYNPLGPDGRPIPCDEEDLEQIVEFNIPSMGIKETLYDGTVEQTAANYDQPEISTAEEMTLGGILLGVTLLYTGIALAARRLQ